MQLEQAIGQRLLLSFVGTDVPAELAAILASRQIGGVTLFRGLNVVNPAQVRALTVALQREAAATGQPPLLVCADQEGGQLMALSGTTPFPGNMALGAAGSVDLAQRVGAAIGAELAAMGVNVNFAPVCDVNINPQNPVIGARAFGEDPTTVGQLAAALIMGMQSAGVAATAKHFPGHGDTAADTHHGLAVLPHARSRLDAVELPPFRAAISANVKLMMSAHLAIPAISSDDSLPATLSAAVLDGLLRRELGFAGVVVSDAMNMLAIGQGVPLIIDTIVAAAAGVDLFLLAEGNDEQAVYDGMLQAAHRGLLPRDGVLAAAERIMALKQWVAAQPQPALEIIGCAAHQALAAEVAARAITLVRDDGEMLPLRLAPERRIAVVVPQTADLTPADTSSYERCELAAAIQHYHPGATEIAIAADPSANEIAATLAQLSGYDLAIVATINAAAQPGQVALVQAVLAESGVPTITVALRLPYDLASYPSAPTYLCTYSILRPALDALAAALWGQAPISGHLPVTIPGLYQRGHGLQRGSA